MKKILFWKSVGGFLYTVKLSGRWYYVGSTGADGLAFHSFMKEHNLSLERVQGMPKALSDIWDRKGSTVNALKQSLPFWTNYFKIERR